MGKLSKNHFSMYQWRTDACRRMVSRDLRIKLHEIWWISFDWPHLQRGQVSLCSHKKCAFKTMYVQFCDEAKSCAHWLVNETLWHETETRPRHMIFNPRRDRDRDLPTFPRDRDVWKLRLETVSRPRRRDRDYIPGCITGNHFVVSTLLMSSWSLASADIWCKQAGTLQMFKCDQNLYLHEECIWLVCAVPQANIQVLIQRYKNWIHILLL